MDAWFVLSKVGTLTDDPVVVRDTGVRVVHRIIDPLFNLTTPGVVAISGVDRIHALFHEFHGIRYTLRSLIVRV